jgi:predicted DNA-binding antitoxin AbrB/MazE fold protein
MQTVHAIYENGVFRPFEPVALPEQTEVEFELRLVSNGTESNGNLEPSPPASTNPLSTVYAILSERYESGYSDTAARHNEHQP